MNLENLNLVELDVQEMQKVDGGILPLAGLVLIAVVAGGCAATKTVSEHSTWHDNNKDATSCPYDSECSAINKDKE